MKEYLSVSEVIKECDVSRATLYRYTDHGLRYILRDGHRYFNKQEVLDFITYMRTKKHVRVSPKIAVLDREVQDDTIKFTVGTYICMFEDLPTCKGREVFLVLNEGNQYTTLEQIVKAQETMKEWVRTDGKDNKKLELELEKIFPFGVQVVKNA